MRRRGASCSRLKDINYHRLPTGHDQSNEARLQDTSDQLVCCVASLICLLCLTLHVVSTLTKTSSQTNWQEQGQWTRWIQISISSFYACLIIVVMIFGLFFLPSTDLHKLDYGKQSMCFHIKTSFKPPSSQSLNNNPSLCVWLSVFGEKKNIQGSKFNTFLSAELQSFRQLTRQCREWVSFYTLPCQFSGSYASRGCGEVSHRHRPFHPRWKQASDSLVRLLRNKRGCKFNKNTWREAKRATNPCSFW